MQGFASVWDALEPTPERAVVWRLRSDLLIAVRAAVDGWGVDANAAADRLGLDASRFEDLVQGRIDVFTLDDLVAAADRAGLTLRVTAAAA